MEFVSPAVVGKEKTPMMGGGGYLKHFVELNQETKAAFIQDLDSGLRIPPPSAKLSCFFYSFGT